MLDIDETIAAIASPRDGALRGIVRISGPDSIACLESIFQPLSPSPRSMDARPFVLVGHIRTQGILGLIPCHVYVWPTNRSYTRQPTLEIHTLGSPPILDSVLSLVCAHRCRLARPGEFTLRAFLAGRIDLTQAEAVLGVIDAHDSRELEVALRQLAGGLAKPLTAIRDKLLDLLARIEAGLDFVEEDIEFISDEEMLAELSAIRDSISDLLERMERRVGSIDGARIVLAGCPNVGKSSLFNRLTGGNVIVSDQPGTTRDYVTASINIEGRRITVVDTAGVQAADANSIDATAQQFAIQQVEQATIRLLCLDSTRRMNAWERSQVESMDAATTLIVLTKEDLPRSTDYAGAAIDVSAATGAGIDRLRAAVADRLPKAGVDEVCIGTTAVRCRESLRRALGGIDEARGVVLATGGDELIAAELRLVLHLVGEMAGEVYTDDVLDRIFSRFCIGK